MFVFLGFIVSSVCLSKVCNDTITAWMKSYMREKSNIFRSRLLNVSCMIVVSLNILVKNKMLNVQLNMPLKLRVRSYVFPEGGTARPQRQRC